MYYQPQSGGLCRLHSINGYFGCDKISTSEFAIFQDEYDNICRDKFHITTKCSDFDILNSDQVSLVSFILKKYNVYTKHYPLNTLYTKSFDEVLNILDGDYFFIYNEGHIWGIRRKDNSWFNVNSIGGISPASISSLPTTKNTGFIVPVNMKKTYYQNLNIIKQCLSTINPITIDNISSYLRHLNAAKSVLGDLEIPLSICLDILETNLAIRKHNNDDSPDFDIIQQQVDYYNEFMRQFSDGNYNNLTLILTYLPSIIHALITV
jgi:hypothetical protein